MVETIFLNGRFLHQPVTGVQRFASELTRAIDALADQEIWRETEVLAPGCAPAHATGRGAVGMTDTFRRLRLRAIGRFHGHLWEQAELPRAARGGVLVSLGNTAPVLGGRRQVVVIHDAGVFDTPESYSLRFRAWYKALQRRLVRTGVEVATVSEFSRGRIAERLGVDPARIAVVYEGADHILRVPADPAALVRHGLRPWNYVLAVGSRVAHKNLVALRKAADALARRGMTLAVAGGGDPGVFSGVADANHGERRLGRISDAELRALYESAACLLFPSRYEGFGLPPVEAMACGCPVLAARVGAVEEICGDSALYFDNDEPCSIMLAVERLLDEDGLAERLRERGRARSAALSWEASARALGDVVRRLR
ncbi:MAG: glycosyltransferase family 4 protein [Proteobacteria bacterium]|nr:glycosyltransferase family 4 protein [Pseudomonadota bacterium]